MRNYMLPVALFAGLALGSPAPAATPPAATPAAKPPAATAGAKAQAAATRKRDACSKTWLSQKTHVGTRKDFMQACIAKG